MRSAILLAGALLLAQQPRAAEAIEAGSASQTDQDGVAASASEPTSDLGKVVVRSRKPAVTTLEAERDDPKSVSVVSGEELESLDALNVTEVLKRIGNVQWNFGNPMTGSLSIRGITTSAGGVTIDPSLGVTVDGVPYAYIPLATQLDYVDVGTISVSRGPQGSTGGINTSTGTIAVNNNQPSFTPEAHGSLILGELNAVIAQAAIGGPVIDDLLAWRATFYRDQQQGAYNNAYADNKGRVSWGNSDRTLGRVQFLLTPSEDLNILFSATSKPKGIEFTNGLSQAVQQPYYYADGKATYIANGLTGATNTVQNKLTRGYFTSADPLAYQNYLNNPVLEAEDKGIENAENGGLIKVTWELPRFTLQSITGYENAFFQASNGTTEWDVTSDGGVYSHYRQESEELSLSSKGQNFVDYKTGLFYLQSSGDFDSRSRYGADAGAYDANASQYALLSANSSGMQLLENSLNRVYAEANSYTANRSAAVFGQADWHLTQPLTLTTGLRLTREDRQTSQNKLVTDDGFGADLDPGAFNSNAAGSLTTNTAAQLAIANAVAQQYFGTTYSALSAAQKSQIAAAKAVRASNAYAGLYNTIAAQPYQGTLPSGNVSLSYKFADELTGYVSWQRGVKAGISQIAVIRNTPVSLPAAPETSNSYELGLKGDYLHNTLVANVDVFLDLLHNFQQSVGLYDSTLSVQNGFATYDQVTGNAPLVEVRGLEVDAAYTGIKNLTLRFAGDYNDAFYKQHIQLAQPVERGDLANTTYDAIGQTLYDSPKFSGTLAAEYSVPVFSAKLLHTNLNYHYISRYNSDPSNSAYAWVNGYGLADFSVGIGRRDRKFDVNFLVKNALNTSYHASQTWSSYVPGTPRWFGVGFSATLL